MSSFFNQFGDLSQTLGHAVGSVGSVVQQQVINQSNINEELRIGSQNVIVREKLAEGGFGLIELVVDTHSQRELVLKRCNIDRPEVREIVQKEINILQRFKGPYVVNLLGHDVNQKRTGTEALLLMEYYPGGHLLDRLNQRHGSLLPIQSVYTIFGQLLQSVNALHTSRPPIIHRDLKLENILIGPDGKVRLCDFGSCLESPIFCRNMNEKEAAEASIQKETTQMYRAPEMADIYMRDYLTEKTDVWALGCIFYALMFLKHPFQDKGNLAIMSGNYVIPNPSPVPPDAIEYLKRMLDVDPEARPSCSELITQLAEIYAGRPLPPFVLTEEALQRRKEREAKNVVRSDPRKKVVQAVPQRKGAPPAVNSAAAKRLAAKKGEVVTSSASSGFDVDFTDNSTSFVASSDNNGFDPFVSEGDDAFSSPPITMSTNSNNFGGFDPFADNSSSTQPLRQPSFTATQPQSTQAFQSSFTADFPSSGSTQRSTSSVASLFPAATPVAEDSFAPSIPSKPVPFQSSFGDEFTATVDFDLFAASTTTSVAPSTPGSMRKPSFLDEYVPPSSSSKAVRKPSFNSDCDFTPTKPVNNTKNSTTNSDFHSFEPSFDPFASPNRRTSHGFAATSSSASEFDSLPIDPFSASQSVPLQHSSSASRSSFTASMPAPTTNVFLPPVVELVPTAAPVAHNQVNLVDDLISSHPVVNSHSKSNSFGMDLLTLSEAPVLTPSKVEPSRHKSVVAKTPSELLSLYDQVPPPQQQSQGQGAKPIMLNNSQPPPNPFAPRPIGGNAISGMGMMMGSQPAPAPMRSASMMPQQPYQYSSGTNTYVNNPASRPIIVNNPASSMNTSNSGAPVRPSFSSPYGSAVNNSNVKKDGDPFASLNVLTK